MYFIEDETVRKQKNISVPDAMFGDAVDKLGRYEDLGEVEELIEKLDRLDKLERKEAG